MVRFVPPAVWAALALASPASGLDRGPPAQALGPVKTPRVDLRELAITNTSPSEPCRSTEGAFARDGTQSWEPSCFGTFLSAGQDIRVFPTRGTAKDAGGQPTGTMSSGSLIQAQGNGAVARESNGQVINMDVVGGAISARELDTTNTTGQLISVRQRPGPNGERPPSTWGHNVDLHIAPGSGKVLSFGVEYDINNFNQDCAAGSGCLSAGLFMNGINGAPNTAWMFSGSGNTRDYGGTVTVAGGVVTRVSGDAFVPAITLLRIGGTEYRALYRSADRMEAEVVIPNASQAVAWTSKNAAVHDGILFNGTSNVSDNDFHAATTARTAFRAGGRHHIGLDTSADSLTYASVAAPNQLHCYNGYDACWSFVGGLMQYNTGGTIPLQIVSPAGGGNGLVLTTGAAGSGPTLTPRGTEASLPLDLAGKGGAPVRVRSGLAVTGAATFDRMIAPTGAPPSSRAPCIQGEVRIDAAYVYACVAANTWGRSPLSAW